MPIDINWTTMSTPQHGEAEYLCYQIIKQVREQHGQNWDLPKTTFNKLCYIADKELQKEGIDVELPVHWYRYGGVLTEEGMDGGFYELIDQKWDDNRGQNVVLSDDIDDEDFEIEEERATDIEEEAGGLVRELGGYYGINISQDYQYEEYAPNEFIRCLHEYRDFLTDLDENGSLATEDYVEEVDVSFQDIVSQPSSSPSTREAASSSSDETNSRIRDYLDQLIIEYPEEKYSRMEDQFLEWENLSWQMAQNGFYSRLYDFMDSFWNTFSRVELRIRHNRNVPMHIRSRWNQQVSDEMESFQSEIEEYRNVVLENREETEVLDMVGDTYSDTVRGMFDQTLKNE